MQESLSLDEITREVARVIILADDPDTEQTTENLQVVIQVFSLLENPMFTVNEQVRLGLFIYACHTPSQHAYTCFYMGNQGQTHLTVSGKTLALLNYI